MKITHKQYDMLQGFYAHCYCVYHSGIKPYFEFYAEILDEAGIPWSIQNATALLAEDKESISKYLWHQIGVKVEG